MPQLSQTSRASSAAGSRRGREQPFQRTFERRVGEHTVREVVEVLVDVDQARERHQAVVGDEPVTHRATGRGAAGNRDEVGDAQPLRHLCGGKHHHVRVGQPLERVEDPVPARVRDRLERDRTHGRVGDPEADHLAHLVLVHPLLDRADERHDQPELRAAVERSLLVGAQVLAADRQVCPGLEPVELQVDVRLERRELLRELAVAREPDPVRVQHHRLDALRLRQRDEVEDLRVDRGLAAGELHDFRRALSRDERVEHALDLLQAQRVAVRLMARVGKADRAIEVAAGVHLDHPEARVLLVLRAKAAVERAAVLHLGLEGERDRPRLVEPLLGEVELGVGVDERLEHAVLAAALPHEHAVVADVHFGVDHHLADGADRLRQLEEDLVAVGLRRGALGHALCDRAYSMYPRTSATGSLYASPSVSSMRVMYSSAQAGKA